LVPLAEVRPAREVAGALHCHAAVHARVVELVARGAPPQLRALLAAAATQWAERTYGVTCAGKPLLKVGLCACHCVVHGCPVYMHTMEV
jgi:hypothetical protein